MIIKIIPGYKYFYILIYFVTPEELKANQLMLDLQKISGLSEII